MKYQYHNDGTNTRYTVDGVDYARLEDMPEEHRAHFSNLDKNNNGVPDNIESLFNTLNNSSGKSNVRRVATALFDTVKSEMTSDDSTQTLGFASLKGMKDQQKPKLVQKARYDQRGGVIDGAEKSFIPTLIKILLAVLVVLGVAWYFGWIK